MMNLHWPHETVTRGKMEDGQSACGPQSRHYIYYYLPHEAELSDIYSYVVGLRSSSAVTRIETMKGVRFR